MAKADPWKHGTYLSFYIPSLWPPEKGEGVAETKCQIHTPHALLTSLPLGQWLPVCVLWNPRVPGKAMKDSVGQSMSLHNTVKPA